MTSVTTFRCSLRIFLALFLFPLGCGPYPSNAIPSKDDQTGHSALEHLSSDGQRELQAIVATGRLDALRWPNFSDYQNDVSRFYSDCDDSLAWIAKMQPTPQAQAMIALFQNAESKGLNPEDYEASRWGTRLEALGPLSKAPREIDAVKFDVALTVSAMRYVSDLHNGRVNPQHLDFQVDIALRRYDLAVFLSGHLIHSPNVNTTLVSIEPPYPGYQRTIQALSRYRQMAREDDAAPLPPVRRPIKPGESYAGVPRLTHLLELTGDLAGSVKPDSQDMIYEGVLVDAVRNFQKRDGLLVNGRIDAKTVAELNVPLARRVRQMELTLERWRWLPQEYQNSPIIVNIPEFQLRAYDDQFHVAVTMKVVVGKALGHGTPVFMDQMRSIIFRPYWNVPQSIVRTEILPELERNSNYLAKEDMEIVDKHENVIRADSVSDDIVEQLKEGRLSLRQRPGPKNSLGLIKFVFPNQFDVYMHDTPATELFSESRRDFSHGCIRLEKPAELAAWVLRNNPGWTLDRIRTAMNGSETEAVTLVHPIPVLIVYGTVIVSEDGMVHFYDDIYGHDMALEKALDKGYPYPR